MQVKLEESKKKEPITELEVTSQNLVSEINQFIAERKLGEPKMVMTGDVKLAEQSMELSRQYRDQSSYLFTIKFRQRITDLAYKLHQQNMITDEELKQINWFSQPEYPSIDWALRELEKYNARFK